jgi:hypothetical protein
MLRLFSDSEVPNIYPSASNGGSLVLSARNSKDMANVVNYFSTSLTAQVKSYMKPAITSTTSLLAKIFVKQEKAPDVFENFRNVDYKVGSNWVKNKFIPDTVKEIKNFIGESSVFIHEGLAAIEEFDSHPKDKVKDLPEDLRAALQDKMQKVKDELEDISLSINDEIQAHPIPTDFKVLDNHFVQFLGACAVLGGQVCLLRQFGLV